MPFVRREGRRVYWRTDGRPESPALLLTNSLGSDTSLWDAVVPALARHFHVLRLDMPGHGASDVPSSYTEWTIEDLARDALAVADAAGASRFCYAGISIGGMIGIWLAANVPERLERAALSNTAAEVASGPWAERIATVRAKGLPALVDAVMQRWFTSEFLQKNGVELATIREHFLQTDPAGYAGCCAAIRDLRIGELLGRISAPMLVIAGTHDAAMPPALGRALAVGIPQATYLELPVAHIPHPEQPERFTRAIEEHMRG